MELNINLPEKIFIQFCAKTITEIRQTIEKSLCDSIDYAICESLKSHDFFLDVSYQHIFELYDECLSLKEYIDNGYISISFFNILLKIKALPDNIALNFPPYLNPIKSYPANIYTIHDDYRTRKEKILKITYQKVYPANEKKLKTISKYTFKLGLVIFSDILQSIYNNIPDDFDMLLPSNFALEGDWRQTFYNIKTGESYFCNCFKKAIQNKPETKNSFRELQPHIKYALDNNSYRMGICHLCTKTMPPKMNGINNSFSFARTYSAYIFKTMYKYKKEKTFKEAENIVRNIVGFPLIGAGWVSETDLYKRIKSEFPNLEVIHHGKPPFLRKQEYDIWIPKYKIAVEYQGVQHYVAIKHWGGEEGLIKRQELDKKKYKISIQNGVTLFYAEESYNLSELLHKIKAAMNKLIT